MWKIYLIHKINYEGKDADEGEKEKSSDYTFQIPSPLVSPLNVQKEKKKLCKYDNL